MPLTSEDAKRGIISLVERGIIPQGAHITLEPPPILPKKSSLNDPSLRTKTFIKGNVFITLKHVSSLPLFAEEPTTSVYHLEPPTSQQLALPVKFSSSPARTEHISSESLTETSEKDLNFLSGNSKLHDSSIVESRKSSGNRTQKGSLVTNGGGGLGGLVGRPLPTPASNFEYKKTFRLVIQNGSTKDQTEDFLQFRQFYCLMWGSIVTVFRMLEKLMHDFAIPIAFVNGEK